MLNILTTYNTHTHTHTHMLTNTRHRKVLEVMGMFSTLIVMMVSQVYAYVQTRQDVYIKCVQLFVKVRNVGKEGGGL